MASLAVGECNVWSNDYTTPLRIAGGLLILIGLATIGSIKTCIEKAG
jgi:hypothetical protein